MVFLWFAYSFVGPSQTPMETPELAAAFSANSQLLKELGSWRYNRIHMYIYILLELIGYLIEYLANSGIIMESIIIIVTSIIIIIVFIIITVIIIIVVINNNNYYY